MRETVMQCKTFTSKSGHVRRNTQCLLRAKSGHAAAQSLVHPSVHTAAVATLPQRHWLRRPRNYLARSPNHCRLCPPHDRSYESIGGAKMYHKRVPRSDGLKFCSAGQQVSRRTITPHCRSCFLNRATEQMRGSRAQLAQPRRLEAYACYFSCD